MLKIRTIAFFVRKRSPKIIPIVSLSKSDRIKLKLSNKAIAIFIDSWWNENKKWSRRIKSDRLFYKTISFFFFETISFISETIAFFLKRPQAILWHGIGPLLRTLDERTVKTMEQKRGNQFHRRQRQFHLLTRSWHQFFGMHVE